MTKATVEIDLRDIEDDIIDYVEHNKEDFRYIFEKDSEKYLDEKDLDIDFLLDNIADKSIVHELKHSPRDIHGKTLQHKLVDIINRLSEK
jgi:hypothetical protein